MPHHLYLVMEDDNIPYEGSQWPIAAFTDKQAAEAFAILHTAKYLDDFNEGVEQMRLAEAEIAALPEDPAGYSYEPESAIWAKYPIAREEWETKHFFTVSPTPIPLNPQA